MTLSFSGLWELGVLIVAISLAFLLWRLSKLVDNLDDKLDTLEEVVKRKDEELSQLLQEINGTNQRLNSVLDDIRGISRSLSSMVSALEVLGSSLQRLAKNLDERLKRMLKESLEDEEMKQENSKLGGEADG